ncbi:MAG: hypothetical protein PHP86_03440 [Nevskiales bacterium]|nr:hypothetical protein [Nevskiales bacterium]
MKALQVTWFGLIALVVGCSQNAAPETADAVKATAAPASPGKPAAPVSVRFEVGTAKAGGPTPVTVTVTPTQDLDAVEVRYVVPEGLDVGVLPKRETLAASKAGQAWSKQLQVTRRSSGSQMLGVIVVTRQGGRELAKAVSLPLGDAVQAPPVPAEVQPDGETVISMPASSP